MKAVLSIALAASAAACIGPHFVAGATPAPPDATFACMRNAAVALGFTITSANAASGFFTAEKADSLSPDHAEYSELSVSVYTDRDRQTQYLISPGRSRHTASGERITSGVMVLDDDNHYADEVAKRCRR